MFNYQLEEKLVQRHRQLEWRHYDDIGAHTEVNFHRENRSYLSFTTNNYLGLATHPRVVTACTDALREYGLGSTSAYLIAGYSKLHQALEEALADFFGYPAVLLFSCGYMANLGVITSVIRAKDLLLADRLNHASLVDGCLNSKAIFKRYAHNDITHLESLLRNDQSNADKLIITEGVFSMDGTTLALKKLLALTKLHNASLLMDDSHGIGVLGPQGRGTIETANANGEEITILTGSLGKAFGCYGGFVASSKLIIEAIKQFARTYIYTTATPPAIAAATLAALEIIKTENWRRLQLQQLISYFRKCAFELGLTLTHSETPIQPIILGSNQKALAVSQYLRRKGIVVKAIRPPTVPQNTARIRITLTTLHQKSHIDYLMENLVNAIKTT